jgi:hypothetical protein
VNVRRREFIALALGASACPAASQQPRLPVIFLVRVTSVQTPEATDESHGKKRMMRLSRLVHLQHIDPLAPERRKAFINEARAARAVTAPTHPL